MSIPQKANLVWSLVWSSNVHNVLADRLSRWRKAFDTQDWMFDREEFNVLHNEFKFEVDVCASPDGNNAQLPIFWSEVDSCLLQCWRGRRVYCNPPFNQIYPILQHFLSEWNADPEHTGGTFVLPAWTAHRFWQLEKHFEQVRKYKTGSRIFTSPDWGAVNRGQVSSKRFDRGRTRWPVVVWHKGPLRSSAVLEGENV